MTGTIVVLNSDYNGTEEEPQLFDSVNAAAVWFSHMMLEALTGKRRLSGVDEKTFNAIVSDVARLFAGYDRTTENDPEEVRGGKDCTRWSFGIDNVSSMEQVINELHKK